MSAIINVNLDLSKIPTNKVIVGEKGKYVNLTLYVNDEAKKFGKSPAQNVGVILAQSKEEREGGANRTYVGNGGVVYVGQEGIKTANDALGNQATAGAIAQQEEEDDLPF